MTGSTTWAWVLGQLDGAPGAAALVRSFQVPAGHPLADRTYVYDQALALITALVLDDGETAPRLATGLLLLHTDGGPQRGGFVTSVDCRRPDVRLPEYRTGNAAIATYALLRYVRDGAPGELRASCAEGARRGLAWLQAQQVGGGPLDGLLRGGHGADVGLGFEPGYVLPWASTEHNIDTWHTLRLAAQVLQEPGFGAAADRLEAAVVDRLWSREEQRFWQGRSPAGADTDQALDCCSWGAIFLRAIGGADLGALALTGAARFASTGGGGSGYAPVPTPSTPLVWVEGTAGVALAQLRLGRFEPARATMQALAPIARGGVWPGATRDDVGSSMIAAPAVAAATWVLLLEQALAGRQTIWDEDDGEHR